MLVQPWALLFLALAIPLIVLHALQARPRSRPTTAAFLWRGLSDTATARRRWRAVPLSMSLLLQLLALAAGTLSLAGPACRTPIIRQVIFVLDASASMQAQDALPTRFEVARREIARRLDSLTDGDRAALVRMSGTSDVLATGARADVERALRQVEPGLAEADLRDALTRADQVSLKPVAAASEIVVLTDGTVDGTAGLTPQTLPVHFVGLGSRSNNQAVTMLGIRSSQVEGSPVGGFSRLTNYGEQAVRLPVQIGADGVARELRLVELPARGRAEMTFDLPAGARSVSVALAGQDDLPLDDRAEIGVGESRVRTALLVSSSPAPWQQALGAVPRLSLETVSAPVDLARRADLAVLDGVGPADLINTPLLLVRPPPGNGLVDVRGEAWNVTPLLSQSSEPILGILDPGSLRPRRILKLVPPNWSSTVLDSNEGPLILAGEMEGRRVVILAFDPFASQLDRLAAFPLLVSNVVEWLSAGAVEPFVTPGRERTIAVLREAGAVSLVRPDGTRTPLSVRDGLVTVEPARLVGRYLLREELKSGAPVVRSTFVNLLSEPGSEIAPLTLPDIPASATPSGGDRESVLPFELFVVLMLVLLSSETLHSRLHG